MKTQPIVVLARLNKCGSVTRNWCLEKGITRLSAIIFDFKEAGYKFESKYTKSRFGKDYIYISI
jgi:hypothetical protein